jgi:hypothetical protein
MSMSLDGFVAGPSDENNWIFSTGSPEGRATGQDSRRLHF